MVILMLAIDPAPGSSLARVTPSLISRLAIREPILGHSRAQFDRKGNEVVWLTDHQSRLDPEGRLHC